MKRAHHPEQKEARRQAILDMAATLLPEKPFPAFHMAELAERLDLAKGTLYRYFPTKESLFLALLQGRLEGWFRRSTHALAFLAPGDPERVAETLVNALMDDPILAELLGLLHGVLEQNVAVEEVIAFKRTLLGHVDAAAPVLERTLPGLAPGQGVVALLRLHPLVVGIHLQTRSNPVLEAAYREPGLAGFALDFRSHLNATLTDLFRGMSRA